MSSRAPRIAIMLRSSLGHRQECLCY